MDRNSLLIIGIAQNHLKDENAPSCHRNGQWVLSIKKNKASEKIFLSSNELSLPTSISAWSWPATNLVLRRPKDLIHVETPQILT